MLITVNYFAQAAESVGLHEETFEADDVRSLVAAVHERHGERVERIICDAEGAVVPWVMVDVGGRVERDPDHRLADGDRVRFIAPISGG